MWRLRKDISLYYEKRKTFGSQEKVISGRG